MGRYLLVLSLLALSSISAYAQDFRFIQDNTDHLGMISTDGTDFRLIRDIGALAAVSSDMTTIARNTSPSETLATFQTWNLEPESILDGPFVFGAPSVTFDGHQVVYTRTPAGGITDVYVINSDGTGRQNISNTPDGIDSQGAALVSYGGVISENGATVAFISTANLVDDSNPDRGRELFVVRLRPGLAIDGGAASCRSNGERFVFSGFGFSPTASVGRYLRRPDDTVLDLGALVADNQGHISWEFSPDSQMEVGRYQLWTVDRVTGTSSNIVYEVVGNAPGCSPLPVFFSDF